MKRLLDIALLGLLTVTGGPAMAQTPSWPMPSDAEIRKILSDRIDIAKQGVGMVVGIVDPKGQHIVSYGALNQGDPRLLDGNTEFEIGSMTKVFTSLILADMVQHKEVALDDPVQKFLPATVKIPSRNGKQITLIDLATHSSGLPRLPTNFAPKDPANPYADYTVDQMYAFLNSYALPRDPGALFEYSNLGVGLLGHALGLRASSDYETLVRQRILGPLGMKDTAITLSPDMKARLAVGHGPTLEPVKNWDFPTTPGQGALRSTANDMLIFLAAELGLGNSPLKESMATQLSVRRPTDMGNTEIALGWMVLNNPNGTVVWHNGGTGGYQAYFGFNMKTKTGVVVLSNTATATGTDDIGLHLLVGTPLLNLKPPPVHAEIAMDTKAKQAFVGQYQLAPTYIVAITLDGNQLYEQAPGQSRFPIFPESPTQFFLKVVDSQLSFDVGSDGTASAFTLHAGGRDIPGKRIN